MFAKGKLPLVRPEVKIVIGKFQKMQNKGGGLNPGPWISYGRDTFLRFYHLRVSHCAGKRKGDHHPPPATRAPSRACQKAVICFMNNFLEKLQEVDTSRLLHSKDNRLNCVIGGFSCSSSNQNVLKNCHKVKTFFKRKIIV
eukprot:sb/3474210/